MRLRVVVTAAGVSRRMGGPNKLLLPLEGRPVLVWALETFQRHPAVEEIVVSAPAGLEDTYQGLAREHGLERVSRVVTGGAERQESIHRALLALGGGAGEAVAVHDGARPLHSLALLDRLLEGLEGWDGVIPALPLKDTIKRVAEGSRQVLETPSRAELVAVQTPQVFPSRVLLSAYELATREGRLGTDDASLVEAAGGRVRVVEGEPCNLKITTPEDLELARLWLGRTRAIQGGVGHGR